MTREEARVYIREHATDYLERDNSGKGYVCPICGSGSGRHGTGITTEDGEHFTCWAGGKDCFKNADIFEIIGKQFHITEFAEQFTKACELFGITPDRYEGATNYTASQGKKAKTQPKPESENYSDFCKEASKHISETSYHRGISLETLKRFGVGYVPNWKHPKAPANVPTSPRLIIPNDCGGYLARDTRENPTEEQRKYTKQRGGKMGLFNAQALAQREPVFVVEGEFDALSILDAGGEAVALCSITNAGKLIDFMKEHGVNARLILALDNDEAGAKTTRQIIEAFQQIKFSFYRNKPLPEQYKDANEFFIADREAFTAWVKEEKQKLEEEKTEEREAFERESVAYHLPEFVALVKANRDRPAIPTGFSKLDDLLGGGLYAGLYFIGAISSLGKTTLALQIADNVAEAGYGVLIFSLEMARSELMAKTLSRLSFLKSYEIYESTRYAKTTRGILRGYFPLQEEQEVFAKSLSVYEEWGRNIHITEGVGDVGVSHIRAKTEEYIKYIGKPPVIVIDYLQILQNPECKHSLTDKQAVDKNVMELKRISRDYDTPVIGISSFNRDNYSAPVNMASFKESGAVEYSSDVLIGLQYYGWDFQDSEKGKGEKDAQRMVRIRAIREANEIIASKLGEQDIQLKVLKNRNDKRGSCRFNFWPAFNYFREKE